MGLTAAHTAKPGSKRAEKKAVGNMFYPEIMQPLSFVV